MVATSRPTAASHADAARAAGALAAEALGLDFDALGRGFHSLTSEFNLRNFGTHRSLSSST
jgi:hypothetical protein